MIKVKFFIVFAFFSSIVALQGQIKCGMVDPPGEFLNPPSTSCINPSVHSNANNNLYIPDQHSEKDLKTIRLVFHIMQYSNEDPKNFKQEHIPYLLDVIDQVNKNLLVEVNCPIFNSGGACVCDTEHCEDEGANDCCVYDSKLQLHLDPNDIYFRQDPLGWDNSGPGNSVNCPEATDYVFQQYGEDEDCKLNVFFISRELPTGSNWDGCGPGYNGEGTNFVLINNNYTQFMTLFGGNYGDTRQLHAVNLIHEIGHNLGLHHTDFTSQQNLFSDIYDEVAGCSDPNVDQDCSNNIMARFRNKRNWLSSLQIAHMHRLLLGSWRSKMIKVDYDQSESISISNTETWEAGRIQRGDIIIKSGGVLNIKCLVIMPPTGRILVEPGGKLVVDGGHITLNSPKCSSPWKGIEVLGTENASQFTSGQQGTVELYDALIEYAVTGVSLYNRHNYDSGGGILKAENSTFSNCQRAIGAAKYENFLPSTPPRPFYNLSYIKNCVFTLNDDFPFASFWGHILFDRIRGINVSGSKLEDSRTTVNTEALLGAGINGYDSRYTVSSTTFENLRFGINAQNVSSVNTFTVRGSSFTNNHIGVNVRAVNNFTVAENCQFTVGGFAFDDQLTSLSDPDLHLGVFIDQSTGFTVKENTFTGDNSSGNIPIGVGAKNTNFITGEGITLDQNEIFKNTFQDLEIANLANNFNTGNDVDGGLIYICNENNIPNKSNVVDVAVVGSIGVNQVAGSNESVSNKFSHLGGDPSFSDINNLEGNDINYFYYGPGSVEDPIYSPPVKVNPIVTTQNACSSTIEDDEISDQDLPGVVSGFDTRWQAYKNAKAAYIGLMDGGDQQATLSLVNGATVFNMSSVKAQLLGYAPYLSGAVIEAIIDHQVFPSTDKSDLLAANPEVIRKNTMWSYIENSGAFSSQQLLTLEQAAQQTTARTTTERNLASAYGDMQRSAKRLIRHYQSDSISLKLDSIRYYLDAKLSLEGAFDQVESWLQEDNTSAADNFLQSITTNFSLNTTQLAEFNYYNDLKQLCIDLLDSNRDYADLTSNELTLVQNIAGNSTGLASVQAQNLLNRAYGGTYQHEPILPQGTGQLSRPEVDATIPTASFQPVVNVTAIPNPARDQVRFDFESIQPLSKAQLVVSDINGSVVFNVALAEDATHYLWDTSALTQGIYFYRLLSEQGESATHKLVIIR